jgi:sulfate permease, SulP family
LGTLVRFIPISVVIGFTNGIAVLIALSQIKEFLGLTVPHMPGDFFGIVNTLAQSLHTVNVQAAVLAALCLSVIVLWQFAMPRLALRWPTARKLAMVPASILVLVLATVAVTVLNLPVETIGSRFGEVPNSLPGLVWPEFSWETARFLLLPAFTLAMLGAIESLLCARVADSVMGDRHDSNQELMAQGIANFVTPFFGGMPATGTIARTMTNAKSGATSPIAGIVHAATLLLVVLVAAPLAHNIPMAAMAAILMFVAWNMGEWREFVHLRQYRVPYRITLLSVFFLTVVFDLTVAVEVGLVAACVTFIYRISSLTRAEPVSTQDQPMLEGHTHQVQAYRLHGAVFFAAVKLIEAMEDHLPEKALVLDFKNVLYIDSSGADTVAELLRSCDKQRVRCIICGLAYQPLDILTRCGVVKTLGPANLSPTLAQALHMAIDDDAH